MQQQNTDHTQTYLDYNNLKISIIIPTYEAKGKGSFFLKRCLDSIITQTYTNFEVIIADHSKDDVIKDLLINYPQIDIKHFFNERGRGNSSINMNEGIKKAKGDIIKILHFDDMFAHINVLQMLADLYQDPSVKWGAFTFNHLQNGELIHMITPSFNGVMGCPSTSFFINDKNDPIYFDEELIIINDKDMHYRLQEKYGEPNIITTLGITIGLHEGQVSNFSTSQAKETQEWEYYNNKINNKKQSIEIDLLTKLANMYASDKGTIAPSEGHHGPRLHFTPIYNQYMEAIRYQELVILEIGVGSGPSLAMWYNYFPNAKIHAIDIVSQTQHNNDRVTTHICDQSNQEQLREVMNQIGQVDLIVDDGSHVVSHQQISLGTLFPYLKPNGQYWIEDLHTSDGSVWQGKTLYGYDMSFNKGESTVDVLESFESSGKFYSPFLTEEECSYLTNNAESCRMFTLPTTFYGVNKLNLITKKG
jgi:glycosyltransferase involved in cell wall biosynthesis